MSSVRIFEKRGGAGLFFSFFEMKCTPKVFLKIKLKGRCLCTKVSCNDDSQLQLRFYIRSCKCLLKHKLQVQYQKHKELKFGNKLIHVEEQKL